VTNPEKYMLEEYSRLSSRGQKQRVRGDRSADWIAAYGETVGGDVVSRTRRRSSATDCDRAESDGRVGHLPDSWYRYPSRLK
jgi:hypothetical protein